MNGVMHISLEEGTTKVYTADGRWEWEQPFKDHRGREVGIATFTVQRLPCAAI
jgi:hypothetical protein